MLSLLRCQRGSTAFATTIALSSLIGVVSLGAEGGSWYVIKQHEQHAADSAALSGAVAVANSQPITDFGAPNGFSSTITQGSYSPGSGFSPDGSPINAVQAAIVHCEQQALSLILTRPPLTCNDGSGDKSGYATIQAKAIATINNPPNLPCALATNGPVTFQDAAVQVNAPNCTIASNGSPTGFNFKVTPNTPPKVAGMTTSGGCSGSLCGSVTTYAPKTIDPFSALTAAISGLTLNACTGAGLQSYAVGQCANSGNFNSATVIPASGVYFFSSLSLGGNGSLTTPPGVSATIIVLPNSNPSKASLSMAGGSALNITAPTTAPTVLPNQLAKDANLLTDMAIFDPETSPKITGGATMSGNGVFYLPNANPLTYQGNSTSTTSTCTEVIAASITFSGTPSFDNSGCPSTSLLKSQLVSLVQ